MKGVKRLKELMVMKEIGSSLNLLIYAYDNRQNMMMIIMASLTYT